VSFELHVAAPAELDASTLYRVLQLRVEVFVVEQQCPYPELDGRDLEPGTRWLWATQATETTPATEPSGAVLATLRILRESDGTARIGRVATARQARAAGLATDLVRQALRVLDETAETEGTAETEEGAPGIAVVLDAQTPLADWYRRFGFEPDGPEFVEDGISHLPMRRPPLRRSRTAEVRPPG
jgi:ElaA protein